MKVFVFGNQDYAPDSLPLRLLPDLRTTFPHVNFLALDPNENWEVDPDITVIDTVINLDQPRVFESLAVFEQAPRVSMHDFDALTQLKLLAKLGRINSVKILGLPPNMEPALALDWLKQQLG